MCEGEGMMKQTGRWKMVVGVIMAVPVLAVFALYLFYRMSPLISQLKINLVLVEYGVLEDVSTVKGIIIRNETAHRIPENGNVRWSIQDGQKIAKQQKLADVLVSDEDQALLLQQQLVEMRLKTLHSGGDLAVYSEEALQEMNQRMLFLMTDIRHNLKNDQYELAFQNQLMLREMSEQKELIAVHQNLPEMSVEELEFQKQQIEDRLDNLSHEIRSVDAGILSIGSDGLEKSIPTIYTDEEVPDLMEQVIQLLEDDMMSELDSRYYRIIHEHKWNMFIAVDSTLSQNYERGERVLVRDLTHGKEIRGRLMNVLTKPRCDQAVLHVEFYDELTDWHRERQYLLELVQVRHEGLIVPASAVVTDDHDVQSVYRIDVNGHAIRTTVKELGRDESIAVLSTGPLTVASIEPEGEERQVQTIRQYDEVIENPDGIIEGQRVR